MEIIYTISIFIDVLFLIALFSLSIMKYQYNKTNKTLIRVNIDLNKFKVKKEESCDIIVGFPETMPTHKKEEIRRQINLIIDDIREYM